MDPRRDPEFLSYCNNFVKNTFTKLPSLNQRSLLSGNDEWVEYKTEDYYFVGYVHKDSRIRYDYGVIAFKGGSLYEGNWDNDKANGHGQLIHANGEYYVGNFADD